MGEIKVGFLGCGNIGSGVYKILQDSRKRLIHREGFDIKIVGVLVRDVNKKRYHMVDRGLLTDKPEDIINNPDIDIVAEFMGGTDPAKEYILAALNNRKTVVTANKEVVSKFWPELQEAAVRNGVGLYYEASVAGGIPVIKVMNESLQANRVYELMGIINGTTNYILTRMSQDQRDFKDVLGEAQKLGYAEPDPTADIEGYDAVYKLSILASLAFHTRIRLDNIYREGITNISIEDIQYGRELGYELKLLAIAKRQQNCIEVRVHPTFIPVEHPLAAVRDAFNAIFIKGDAVGNLMLYGRGAGDLPTGSAIVSDIITACHHMSRPRSIMFSNNEAAPAEIIFNNDWKTEYFVRLTVNDRPGVLAKIAGIFGTYGVSIASVIQKGRNKVTAPLIFVTHQVGELAMKKAVEDIAKEPDVIRVENVIRVET